MSSVAFSRPVLRTRDASEGIPLRPVRQPGARQTADVFKLVPDVMRPIVALLPPSDRLTVRLVCRAWRDVSESMPLWPDPQSAGSGSLARFPVLPASVVAARLPMSARQDLPTYLQTPTAGVALAAGQAAVALGVDLGLGIPAFVRHDNLFVLAAVVFGGVVGVAGSVAAASYQVRLLKAWYRREQPAPQVAPAPLVMADAVRTWLSPYLLNTKLHRAIDTPFALNGMVTDLLQAGVSANQPDPQGRLPLDKALGRADPNLLKLLLRHGAQPLQEHVALAWRNGSAQQVGALLGIGDPARRAHLAEAVTPAQFREQLTGIGLLEPVLKAATPAHAHRLIHTTTVEAPSSPLHVVAATQQLELFALFLRHGADLTLASDTRRATAQAFVRANPRLAREVQRFHQERQAPAGPTDGEEPPPADVDDL